MRIEFAANRITYEFNSEGQYYIIGFLDDEENPNQYVILQRASVFDAQDIALGTDSYHFEYSDQSQSAYEACRNITLEKDKIIFELKDDSIEGIDSVVIFFQENTIEDRSEFESILKKILN